MGGLIGMAGECLEIGTIVSRTTGGIPERDMIFERGEGGQEDFINGIESSGTIHREARIIGIPVAIESKAMVPFFHRGVCVYISAPQVCTRCTRSSTSTRAISCVE